MTDADFKDPRVYLAVERTFLAWVRTGLALMGFGFVVARFGLFLQEMHALRPDGLTAQPAGLSGYFGTALIFIGVIVNMAATFDYIRTIQRLNRKEFLSNRPSLLGVSLAVILTLIGAAMCIYLVGSL